MPKDIKKFLGKLKVEFNSTEQFEVALTHMSWVNENNLEAKNSYERLEFLGDSVLGLAVSKWLFTHSVDKSPGDMTLLRSKVVNKQILAKISRELKLQKVLRLGKGENRENLSDSVMEDILEAFIGAVYMDSGFEKAEKFVNKHIAWRIANLKMEEVKDFKTKLQEHLQANNRSNVVYKTVKETKSKDGSITFHVIVKFDGVILGEGQGESKKNAEKSAAAEAYSKLVR